MKRLFTKKVSEKEQFLIKFKLDMEQKLDLYLNNMFNDIILESLNMEEI